MTDKVKEAYEKLATEGHNNVDNIVKWFKDSKIIENTQEAEDKAKKMFDKAKDKSKIELEHFNLAVQQIATEQKKNLEQLQCMLVENIPKLKNAVVAAASAFRDELNK